MKIYDNIFSEVILYISTSRNDNIYNNKINCSILSCFTCYLLLPSLASSRLSFFLFSRALHFLFAWKRKWVRIVLTTKLEKKMNVEMFVCSLLEKIYMRYLKQGKSSMIMLVWGSYGRNIIYYYIKINKPHSK